jgi:hypothetical protein
MRLLGIAALRRTRVTLGFSEQLSKESALSLTLVLRRAVVHGCLLLSLTVCAHGLLLGIATAVLSRLRLSGLAVVGVRSSCARPV